MSDFPDDSGGGAGPADGDQLLVGVPLLPAGGAADAGAAGACKKIVNISSNGAYNFDVFDPPHYRASKAAMDTLTKDLARRYAREKIAANSLAPAMTETPLFGVLTEDVLDRAIAAMPHGHAMQPSEIAAWVGFLISAAGDVCSGQCHHPEPGAGCAVRCVDGFVPRQIRPRLPARGRRVSAPAQSGADGLVTSRQRKAPCLRSCDRRQSDRANAPQERFRSIL